MEKLKNNEIKKGSVLENTDMNSINTQKYHTLPLKSGKLYLSLT